MAFKIPFFFNDTATDKGSAWSADAIINSKEVHLHPGYIDGVYYAPSNNVGSDSVGGIGDDLIYFSPIRIEHEVTVTRLGFSVSVLHTASAGDENVLMGIYNADTSTGLPSTLIVSSSEIDIGSGAGTGEKEATISQVLTPGPYWIALYIEDDDSGNVDLITHTQANGIHPEFGATTGTPTGMGLRTSRTYDGTLPASSGAAASDIFSSNIPHVWWRKGV